MTVFAPASSRPPSISRQLRRITTYRRHRSLRQLQAGLRLSAAAEFRRETPLGNRAEVHNAAFKPGVQDNPCAGKSSLPERDSARLPATGDIIPDAWITARECSVLEAHRAAGEHCLLKVNITAVKMCRESNSGAVKASLLEADSSGYVPASGIVGAFPGMPVKMTRAPGQQCARTAGKRSVLEADGTPAEPG
ncbi:MAG TPA: hypothetical protein VFV41_12085, partial [Streptosporangiaceae bacterium]|nr:hypothetical protein [Streptosporangiaceae bacterium]